MCDRRWWRSRRAALRAPAGAGPVTALDARQRPVQPARACGREAIGEVAQLERVAAQLVVLAFAGGVLDVKSVRRPDRLIARWIARAACRQIRVAATVDAPVVLDEDLLAPAGRVPAMQQRDQAVAIDACRHARARELLKARAEIHVLAQLRDG